MVTTLALSSLLLATVPAVRDEVTRDHVLFSLGGQFKQVKDAPTPEELVGKIRFSNTKTVIIFLHGGLVTTAGALKSFRKIHSQLGDNAYPVYVSWESGPEFSLFPPQAPPHKGKREHSWREGPPIRPPYPLGDAERRLEHNTRGFGKLIWGQMKRFISYGTDPKNPEAVVTRFMHSFVPLWKERKLRVILVGHSAGAIYISRIIENLSAWRGDRVVPAPGKGAGVEVVFLAPACTYEFVANRRAAYLAHVRAFRMFSLADDAERYDALLAVNAAPKVVRHWYDASLLYYISNNLEGQVDRPLVGMERFWRLTSGSPVVMARDLATWERSAIKVTDEVLKLGENAVWSHGIHGEAQSPHPALVGWRCAAARHMDFWDDGPTLESLREIAAHPMPPLR